MRFIPLCWCLLGRSFCPLGPLSRNCLTSPAPSSQPLQLLFFRAQSRFLQKAPLCRVRPALSSKQHVLGPRPWSLCPVSVISLCGLRPGSQRLSQAGCPHNAALQKSLHLLSVAWSQLKSNLAKGPLGPEPSPCPGTKGIPAPRPPGAALLGLGMVCSSAPWTRGSLRAGTAVSSCFLDTSVVPHVAPGAL